MQIQKTVKPGSDRAKVEDVEPQDVELAALPDDTAKPKVLPEGLANSEVTFVGTVAKFPWYFWFNRKAGMQRAYWGAKAAENNAEAGWWLRKHDLENEALAYHHINNNRIGWDIYAAHHNPWRWEYAGDNWLGGLGGGWLDGVGLSSENVTAKAIENGRRWNKVAEGLGHAGHHQPGWRKDWEIAAALPVDPSSTSIELDETLLNEKNVLAVENEVENSRITESQVGTSSETSK